MKVIGTVLSSGLAMASSALLQAQVAGSTLLEVSVTEAREVADDWSASAVRVTQFKVDGDTLALPGATKEALKQAPEFEYAR